MNDTHRSSKRRWGKWIALGVFVALFVAPFTYDLMAARWKIIALLWHARSVRVEHFVVARSFDGKGSLSQKEVILASTPGK
jgi:hypothetical protein